MPSATTLTLSLDRTTATPGGTITATITPNGTFTGQATITPTPPSPAGLDPVTLSFAASSAPQSATFSPRGAGTGSGGLTFTLTTPSGLTVAGSPASVAVVGGQRIGMGPAGPLPAFCTFANLSTSGDHVIVDAVAGRRIMVLGYSIVVGSGVTVTFKSPAVGAISSSKPLGAGGGMGRSFDSGGHFSTALGDPLVLNLSGDAVVAVDVEYVAF